MGIRCVLYLAVLVSFPNIARSQGATIETGSTPTPIGRIDAFNIPESSGLLLSQARPGVLWTMNDSGNPPRIFPMHPTGKVLNQKGVLVEGVKNIDWESLGRAPDGRIIIGAFGNNANRRKDLALLLLQEPKIDAITAKGVVRVPFRYPDQAAFPPPIKGRAFDCEAVYTHRNRVYVLTKDRGPERKARLYRFGHLQAQAEPQVLEKLGVYAFEEMVTAADAWGDRLAVLTYKAIWVVELNEDGTFGKRRSIPFIGLQCEGIAWTDDHHVLVTNEQRSIFRVRVHP